MARKFNRSTNVLSSNFSSALDRNTGVNVMQRLSDLIAQVYSEDFYKFQSNTFFALVIAQTGERATDIRTARNTFSQLEHQRIVEEKRMSLPTTLYPSCKVRILETGHAFIGDPTDPNGVFKHNRLDQYADNTRPNRLRALNVAFTDMHGFPAYTNAGITPPEYGDVVLVEVDNISDPKDIKILEIVARRIIEPLSFTTEDINPPTPSGNSDEPGDDDETLSETPDSDSQCALGRVGRQVVDTGLEQSSVSQLLNGVDYGFWVFEGLRGLRRIAESIQEQEELIQAGIKNLSIPIDDISSRMLVPSLFTGSPTDELRSLKQQLTNFNIYFLIYPQRTRTYLEENRIRNLIENAKNLGVSGIQLDLEENWEANDRYNGVQLLEEEVSNDLLKERFANKGIRIDVTTIYSTARSKAKRPITEFADNYIAQSFFSNDPVRFGGYDNNNFGMGSTQKTVLRSFQDNVLVGSNSSVKFSYGLTFLNQNFNCEIEEITMAKNLLSTKGSVATLGLSSGRLNNEVWYFQYFHWRTNPKVKNFLLNKATYFNEI